MEDPSKIGTIIVVLFAITFFATREIWMWLRLSKRGIQAWALVKTTSFRKGWLTVGYSFQTQSGDLLEGKDKFPAWRFGELELSQPIRILYSPSNPKLNRIDRGGFKWWWLWQ